MRFLLLLIILTGCSGYRFAQQENPLAQYGIQSISIPMFYNYSNISEASGEFTRETYRLFTNFSGLRIVSGYSDKTDAVLIGIIKGPEKISESNRGGSLQVAQQKAPIAIGDVRQDFYVPVTNSTIASLHIIVIKKPTEEDIALLKSGMGEMVQLNSKVIFNDVIPLNQSSTREYLDGEAVSVVGTQNLGVQRRVIKNLAEQAALSVRDIILYAF